MFEIAILIGIFSYLVFALGILGKLNPGYIWGLTLIFGGFALAKFKGSLKDLRGKLKDFKHLFQDKLSRVLLILIVSSTLVNLIGALGPELGFDALWYHLTLPKIYLQNQRLLFIPGNLLYYSSMPKLVEMLYLAALAIKGEILAKLIHFIFGILSAMALFKLSRRYLNTFLSLMVVTIFYTTLVVGWQSITAYVDLGRTFFEILALDHFLRWWEKEKIQELRKSAIVLGLAVSTKLLALGSLIIFLILIFCKSSKNLKNFLLFTIYYLLFTILIPLPWFVFSFVHTKNPFYPLFSRMLDVSHKIIVPNFLGFFKDFWNLFLYSSDPTLPIFLIFLLLLIWCFKKLTIQKKIILFYCFLSYVAWYFTPRTGGGRFILPYLPAFSLICGLVFEKINQKRIKKTLLIFVFILSLINIGYRFLANRKYLPVILGKENKEDFLAKNLNFQFGDFFDVDGFFAKNIQKNDLVLIYGIHNLYYVNFPFVHESWARSGIPITHILVQGKELPKNFGKRRLFYESGLTEVSLYPYGEKLP